jgi:ribonuclease PH
VGIRSDGREPDEMRPVTITRDYQKDAEGSCLIELGDTKMLCAATVEERVPGWLRGKGSGWVTAEYAMLPRSTRYRTSRERRHDQLPRGIGGRTAEIQRLIGRSMRAVIDLAALGERTVTLDCDAIQADGGTRTAAITGAFVALHDAMTFLIESKQIEKMPLGDLVAATSVGIIGGVPMIDLAFEEDASADVDMNVVMTSDGRMIEIQGTAERVPFAREDMDRMIDLAAAGIGELIGAQRRALGVE